MDGNRFDALTRDIANRGSRRRFLGGLAALIGAGVLGLRGSGGDAATRCTRRCDRKPAGSARDQCLAACASADDARATARANADNARATARANRANGRATAEAKANEARARTDALRACKRDTSRLCGSGVDIACCGQDETCQNGVCTPLLGCVETGDACSADGDCCTPNLCLEGHCAPPLCSSANCNGCCDSDGTCWDGTSGSFCGTDGETCAACGTGQDCCGGACTDLCDGRCCGAGESCCGGVECCAPGQACCGGTCCPTGFSCCGDICTDLENDADNCGICDNTCAPTQTCFGRDCCTLLTCQPGQCGHPSDGCGGTLDCGPCPCGPSNTPCGDGFECIHGGCFAIAQGDRDSCDDYCYFQVGANCGCSGSVMGSDNYLCAFGFDGGHSQCSSNDQCEVGWACSGTSSYGICVAAACAS